MWELTNELWHKDVPTEQIGKDQAAVDWLDGLARYCKEVDPHDHPVGTSLNAGGDTVADPPFQAVQGLPSIDWISVHSYGQSVVNQARHPWVLQTGKPLLSTETYNLGTDFDNARRRTWEGFALASCEMEWSSGFTYDRPGWDQDLRQGFDKLLAVFAPLDRVAAETVEADRWRAAQPCTIAGAVATTDGQRLMAYFQKAVQGDRVTLDGLAPGRYRVYWYDPLTGRQLARREVMMTAGAYVTPPASGELFLYLRQAGR
jgi:hypothetical protein